MPALQLGEPQPYLYVAHHAETRPDAIALSTFERDYSFTEVRGYATAIAGLLRRRGVRPGHLVASQLHNDLNLLFMEATYHEAAVWCSLGNTRLVDLATPIDWLIAHDVASSFATERTVVVDDEFMRAVAESDEDVAPQLYPSFDSVCRVTWSSGTTGHPRPTPGTVARQGRADAGWMEGWPFFSLIQGFSGSGVKIANTCMCQGDTYICPGTPEQNVALAQRNFVATLQGSPIQLAEFVAALARAEVTTTDITTVQYIGSHLSEHLLTLLRDTLGASVTALYGSTEVGMITMRHDVRGDVADVGTPLPGVQVEVVDDAGVPVPVGVEGVLRVRTSRRDTAYFDPGADTRSAPRDGWHYPGDLAFINEESHVVLAGRASEVINAGGSKFAPDAADDVLSATPGVRDGAVFAWTSPSGLSGYAAAVVVDPEFELVSLSAALRAACGGVPPVSIFRVAAVARDSNGKVNRPVLAADVAETLRHLDSATP